MKENKIKISPMEVQIFLRCCRNSKYIYNATPEEVERAAQHILQGIIDNIKNELKQK